MSENRTKKPKLDPYTLLEKRITELSEKLSEIEEKTKRSFQNLQGYIAELTHIIYTDVLLLDDINSLPRQGNISNFDSLIKILIEREQAMREIKAFRIKLPEILMDSTATPIDLIILRSHYWKIPFETIASYLIQKFGKKEAKRLVRKETLLECYGKDSIPIWEKVLEE